MQVDKEVVRGGRKGRGRERKDEREGDDDDDDNYVCLRFGVPRKTIEDQNA